MCIIWVGNNNSISCLYTEIKAFHEALAIFLLNCWGETFLCMPRGGLSQAGSSSYSLVVSCETSCSCCHCLGSGFCNSCFYQWSCWLTFSWISWWFTIVVPLHGNIWCSVQWGCLELCLMYNVESCHLSVSLHHGYVTGDSGWQLQCTQGHLHPHIWGQILVIQGFDTLPLPVDEIESRSRNLLATAHFA